MLCIPKGHQDGYTLTAYISAPKKNSKSRFQVNEKQSEISYTDKKKITKMHLDRKFSQLNYYIINILLTLATSSWIRKNTL